MEKLKKIEEWIENDQAISYAKKMAKKKLDCKKIV